jgi:transcription antitermination factor NusG
MKSWHVWTIVQQRYKKAEEFLEMVPEIDKVLYPTVVKEYATKSGWKKKDVPLYSNYIFIRYHHNSTLYAKLCECPWIRDYVGVCSQKEIKEVKALSKRKYEDLIPANEVLEGHSYKLKGTPFKEMRCTVVSIDGNKLVVSVEIFGSDRLIKCLVDDIDLEG